MRLNSTFSEFLIPYERISDLFGPSQNGIRRGVSVFGLMLPDKHPDTKDMDISFIAQSLDFYIQRMIGSCAFRISIPSHAKGMWAEPKRIKSLLAPSNRRRIQFVDRKHRIWSDIQAYLRHIYEELPIQQHRKGAPPPLRDLLCDVTWNLYILTLSSMNCCEAVLSPKNTITKIDTLLRFKKISSESKSRLSLIRGIFALYSDYQNIPGLKYIGNPQEISLRERLDEVLEDAYLLEASKLRVFLGMDSNRKAIKRDLRKLIKFISKNRSWAKGVLTATSHVASLTSVPNDFTDAFLESFTNLKCKSYAPVLVDPVVYKNELNVKVMVSYRNIPFGEKNYGSLAIG